VLPIPPSWTADSDVLSQRHRRLGDHTNRLHPRTAGSKPQRHPASWAGRGPETQRGRLGFTICPCQRVTVERWLQAGSTAQILSAVLPERRRSAWPAWWLRACVRKRDVVRGRATGTTGYDASRNCHKIAPCYHWHTLQVRSRVCCFCSLVLLQYVYCHRSALERGRKQQPEQVISV
jgi:hypothetical protein